MARMNQARYLGLAILASLIGIVGLGLAMPPSRAELIYLRKGGELQAPATIVGNRVILALPDGKVEILRDDLRKLVPGFWPAAEWEARRRQARAGGFDARYTAAWWAIENGLTMEVIAELRELHALDPKHAPTARMVAVLDRLDQACSDPDLMRVAT